MTDFPPFKKASLYKPHYTGATYELTQEKMNDLITQLEWMQDAYEEIYAHYTNLLNSSSVKVIDNLKSENQKLSEMIYKLTTDLKLAEIENSILKINGKAARNKDGI